MRVKNIKPALWKCKSCGCERFMSSNFIPMALVGGRTLGIYKSYKSYLINNHVYNKAPNCEVQK